MTLLHVIKAQPSFGHPRSLIIAFVICFCFNCFIDAVSRLISLQTPMRGFRIVESLA